jgi:hypothetical protein
MFRFSHVSKAANNPAISAKIKPEKTFFISNVSSVYRKNIGLCIDKQGAYTRLRGCDLRGRNLAVFGILGSHGIVIIRGLS